MQTTQGGVPYPENADALSTWPAILQSLALQLAGEWIIRSMTTAQSIPNAVVTLATLDTTEDVRGEVATGAWSAGKWAVDNAGRITVPRSGLYVVTAHNAWQAAGSSRRDLEVRQAPAGTALAVSSPSTTHKLIARQEQTNGPGLPSNTATSEVYLQAGQQVGMYVYQNSGAALSMSTVATAATRLTVRRVSA